MRLHSTLRKRFKPPRRLPLLRIFSPYLLTSISTKKGDRYFRPSSYRNLIYHCFPISQGHRLKKRQSRVLRGPIWFVVPFESESSGYDMHIIRRGFGWGWHTVWEFLLRGDMHVTFRGRRHLSMGEPGEYPNLGLHALFLLLSLLLLALIEYRDVRQGAIEFDSGHLLSYRWLRRWKY